LQGRLGARTAPACFGTADLPRPFSLPAWSLNTEIFLQKDAALARRGGAKLTRFATDIAGAAVCAIGSNVDFAAVGRQIFVAVPIRDWAQVRQHRRPIAAHLVGLNRVVAAPAVSAAIVQIRFATVRWVLVAVRETRATGGYTSVGNTGGAAVRVFALDPTGSAVRQISSNIGFTAVCWRLVAVLPAGIAAYDRARGAPAHTLGVGSGAGLTALAAMFAGAGEIGFAAIDWVGVTAIKPRRTNGCAGAAHAGSASVVILASVGSLAAVYNNSFPDFKIVTEKARARRQSYDE